MRAILIVATILAAMAGAAFLGFHQWVVKPVEQALAPATPKTSRVDMMAAMPDALILMPFVTGDVPRLVRGPSLERLSRDLWFTDNSDAGNLIGAVLFGMMGMPPTSDLASAFRSRVAVRSFTCLTVGCINWPKADPQVWGLGPLRGRGDALGPEVRREQLTFSDHAAYTAAHAAVAADPLRWFAVPGGEVLQPAPDGLRSMTISLPTRFPYQRAETGKLADDPALKAELEALATLLLKGTSGRLDSMLGTIPSPIWVTKDGQYLRSADGGTRALPDIVQMSPGLMLRIPHEQVAVVRRRIEAMAWPLPDRTRLDMAVARAFSVWRIDASCLPGCGGINPTHDVLDRMDISIGNDPFWTLDTWKVPPESKR